MTKLVSVPGRWSAGEHGQIKYLFRDKGYDYKGQQGLNSSGGLTKVERQQIEAAFFS